MSLFVLPLLLLVPLSSMDLINEAEIIIVNEFSIIKGDEGPLMDTDPVDGFFIENKGQFNSEVLYYYSGSPKVLIHEDGLSIADVSDPPSAPIYRMSIEDSKTPSSIEGIEEGPIFNFYIGSNSDEWVEGAASFRNVKLNDVKPGVDLLVRNSPDGPKWEISLIRGSLANSLAINYGSNMKIEDAGNKLIFSKGDMKLNEGPFDIFQNGEPVNMPMSLDNDRLTFSTEYIDPDIPLLIDPLLQESTLLGGNSWDQNPEVIVHPMGGVIVAGTTESTDLTTHSTAYDRTANGIKDIFVCRFNEDLSSVLYASYFGGTGYEKLNGASLDGSGNVYIAGYTSSTNLPTSSGAFENSYQGAGDGFSAKFDSQLGSLSYSTYLGGTGEDWATGIDVGSGGVPYICGTTRSTDLPTTSGCYQGSLNGVGDGFVVKLLSDGTDATYLTYLGGDGFGDEANDIAVDGLGRAVVAGYAISEDFPTTNGAYKTGSGFYMGYVTRLEADGSDIEMSTFLGYGARVNSTHLDKDGNILLTGWTDSISGIFPVTDDAYDKDLSGFQDGFVSKLSANGSLLLGSTYIGNNEQWGQPPDTTEDYNEKAIDVSSDKDGRIIVSGLTDSINFPLSPDAFDTTRAKQDGFVVMFNHNLSILEYSTFIGGSDEDVGTSVSYTDDGWMYLAGHTYSNHATHDFPTTEGAYDTDFNSQYDCFVIRFKMDSFLPGAPQNVSSTFGETSINLTWDLPLYDGNEPVEEYYVYRGNNPTAMGLLGTTEDRLYSDEGLIKGRTYYYRVKARNKVGISLQFGATFNTPYSIPGLPVLSSIDPGSNHINFTWLRPTDDGGADDLQYQIHFGTSYSDLSWTLGPVSTNWFDLTNLTNGQQYYFAVKAENHIGSGSLSNIGNATPMGRPTPPTNLRAFVGDGSATLFWDEPVDMGGSPGVTYNVFRYYNETYSMAIKYGLLETSYPITGMRNGDTYTYFVTAFNLLGEGSSSDRINITPFGRVSEPFNLSGMEFGDRVHLRWNEPNITGASTNVRYTILMGTDPMDLTAYRDDISSDNHTIHALTPGVTYYFRVSARNDVYNSTLSDLISLRPLKIPEAPSDLTVTSGNSFINVSWVEPEYFGGVDSVSYEVHLGETIQDMIPIGRLSALYLNITELTNGQKYYVAIRAINQKGSSNFTRVLNATPMSVPSKPRIFKYTFGNGFLNLSWESPFDDGGALSVSYIVYLGTNISNMEAVAAGLTERTFLIENLENGGNYMIGVSAINIMGESEMEGPLSAQPMTFPSAVGEINVTNIDEGLLVRWSSPHDDGGSDVWYYRLFRSVDDGEFVLLREFGGHVHEYADLEVEKGSTYDYYIIAETGFGPGPASITVTETIPRIEEDPLDILDPIYLGAAGILCLMIILIVIIALVSRKRKNDRMKKIWSSVEE